MLVFAQSGSVRPSRIACELGLDRGLPVVPMCGNNVPVSLTVFRDDDPAYEAWLAGHPSGWVVNTTRHPSSGYVKLHRATCSTIMTLQTGYSRWTSGDYIKVCADSRGELDAWVREVVGGAPQDGCHCVRSRVTSRNTASALAPAPRSGPAGGLSEIRDAAGFRGIDSPAVIAYSAKDPDLLALREDLRVLLGSMAAQPGELLHGVIQGPRTAGTDLDIALLYNIGGRVAAATKHGVLLERRPAVGEAAVGYRYRLTSERGLGTYREGPTVARFADVALPRAPRSWQDVWLALKTTPSLSIESRAIAGELTLRIRIAGPSSVGSANGEFVKRFVDGVLTALHAHGNRTTAARVAQRVAKQLFVPAHEVEELLLRTDRAALGVVHDLVVARADGVQCWPQDARVATLRIDIDRSCSSWGLEGHVAAVLP